MNHFFRIVILTGLSPAAGLAQDAEPGGLSFTFGLRQQFEAFTDRSLSVAGEDPGGRSTTILTFGALTETRQERLELEFGTQLSDGLIRTNTTADLSYHRTSANAVIDLTAEWVQSDLAFLRSASSFVDADGIVVLPDDLGQLTSTGTRTATTFGASIRWGYLRPLGASLELRHRIQDYDNARATLADGTTTTLSGGLRFNINPVTTANLNLRYNSIDDDGSTVENNAILRGGLTFDRPLGRLVAQITVAHNDDSETRWAASVNRQFELPRSDLDITLGVAQDDSATAQLIGRIAYGYDLPEGRIEFSTGHDLTAGSDRRNTTLQASFTQVLTPISNLQLLLDYARARDTDEDADIAVGTISASYGLQLTPDWSVNFGARSDLRKDSGTASRSHSVFMVLGRSLTWRP
nr:hypothetical protein [Amylibacter sp.]